MTAACEKCGFDPSVVAAARWELFVDYDSKSDNGRTVNAGSSRYAYKANRDLWSWSFKLLLRESGVPKATARRRLTITRVYGGKQKLRDSDNVPASYKPAVDALVRLGLLVDDNAAGVDGPYYKQERGDRPGSRFVIEELASG